MTNNFITKVLSDKPIENDIDNDQYQLVSQNERAKEIFIAIVENYLAVGDPIGSRQISKNLSTPFSPASVRNIMSDLESLGLINAPHTSAGRLPTENGLRFFIDSFLQLDQPDENLRQKIESEILKEALDGDADSALHQTSQLLSRLSHSAGIVLASKSDRPIKHIEFVQLDKTKALVILVNQDNMVENRIITIPEAMSPSILTAATNFLNNYATGKTIPQIRLEIEKHITALAAELDDLTKKVITDGVASWSDSNDPRMLIIHGHANLLSDLSAIEELERIKILFDDLENRKEIIDLLVSAENSEGAHIFIGSENKLFSLSGSSVILAPYKRENNGICGVLGVIGPTRQNYARVVPMVNYTAQLLSKIIGKI